MDLEQGRCVPVAKKKKISPRERTRRLMQSFMSRTKHGIQKGDKSAYDIMEQLTTEAQEQGRYDESPL